MFKGLLVCLEKAQENPLRFSVKIKGAYWFRRVIEDIQSMPSVYQVLVKELVKTISAEETSSGVHAEKATTFAFMPASFAAMEAVACA